MKRETGFGGKGWALIIYCIAAFYVATAFKDTMNIAVYSFQEMYGWNQTLLLSLASIGAYVACAVIYAAGILNANGKAKARTIALIMGLIYAATISLWGVLPNISGFIFNYIIMTIGYTVWTQFANSTICANWFPRKSGAVMGWATIGFPLAAATNALLFSRLQAVMSFKNIYFVFGGITLVVCLIGYFAFKDYPEEMGCYPDNDRSMTREEAEALLKKEHEEAEKSIWTVKKMLTIKETWLIGFSAGVMILVASGSMGQMVVRFMAGGMPIELAIKMMTIVGISAMIGSWAIGKLDYKFGVKKAFVGSQAILAVACLLYSFNSTPLMVTGSIVIGIGLGGATNFVVSLVSHYWGRRNFRKAYGTVLTFATLVGSAGAMVVANLAAAFNYTVAYLVITVLTVLALAAALPLKDGFVEKYEQEEETVHLVRTTV